MASHTAVFAQHATLSGATADDITFSATRKYSVRVTNHDATNLLYFNVNSSTVPTVGADDTFVVRPATSLVVTPGGDVNLVRLVGNANAFGCEIA